MTDRPWADVWWFDARTTVLTEDDVAVLSAEERARADRFRFEEDRARYRVSHVGLRRVLAGYTGTDPAGLAFARSPCPVCGGPNGRPVLAADGGVHFSLAHSGDLVAVAVGGQPVGVDVESPPQRCMCPLASRMHELDRAHVEPMTEPERHVAMLAWWVRLEAVLKCRGDGIGHGVGTFAVLAGDEVAGNRVCQLDVRDGYGAALAVAGPGDGTPPESPAVTVRAQA